MRNQNSTSRIVHAKETHRCQLANNCGFGDAVFGIQRHGGVASYLIDCNYVNDGLELFESRTYTWLLAELISDTDVILTSTLT